jgi:polysaccharide biosynthesis transport protein
MNAPGVQDGWSTPEPQAHGSVFALVHKLLRGRYLLTIAMAVVFGVAGGLGGFMLQKPLFRSESMVNIQPELPKILYETEQATAPRMFASFVNTQSDLMKSPRVIESAMDSDTWIKAREIAGPMTIDQFRASLSVRPDRRSQGLIFVYFEHPNSTVARLGNQALIEEYMEIHGRLDQRDSDLTLGVLQSREETLTAERNAITGLANEIITRYKTDQLGQLMRMQIDSVERLRAERRTLTAMLKEREQFAQDSEDPEAMASALTVERAAQFSEAIRNLLVTRTALEARRSELRAAGFLENHRQMRQVQSGLEQVEGDIQAQMQRLRAEVASGESVSDSLGGPTSQELRDMINVVGVQLSELEEDQARLAEDTIKLRGYYDELEDVKQDLAFVQDRITAIETESKAKTFSGEVSGKISIANNATVPLLPSSDKRIKLAGVGFVGGASLPIGAMLALGLMGKRIRFSDDGILESAHSRVVGVLPDLGSSITDRELAEASAFAVHQIRSQLQILYNTGQTSVFAATSPAPGDGKTSMIIALGLSFAESGDRTLLIDLDMIGRGLSLHFGHPNAPSLADAAASGADLSGLVQGTGFDGLSILPAGMGDEMKISRLSPVVVRRLVDMFRDKYDTVLIDSGPILGSIEACLLAPSVDGVLMVVGRGQLRPLVKRTVDQITGVGGKVAAMVFNRASEAELRQSSSSMSVHFSRQASRQAAEQASGNTVRGGPLAGSLFSASAAKSRQPGTGSTGPNDLPQQNVSGAPSASGSLERDAS